MKKRIAWTLFFLMALALCAPVMGEETSQPMMGPEEGTEGLFQSLTGLDELALKLESGVTIDQVYYTDGYGFSISEFTTTDPEVISALWQALNAIRVIGPVDESITDWYPQIVFYLSDETTAHVTFEAHWLSLPEPWPGVNYALEDDEDFWLLTAALTGD
jgi:hypothetical protein